MEAKDNTPQNTPVLWSAQRSWVWAGHKQEMAQEGKVGHVRADLR